MVEDELIDILQCPVTRTRLRRADRTLIESINRVVQQNRLVDRGGHPVEHVLDDGLINEDGSLLYAIRDDIPTLIPEQAIPLDQQGLSKEAGV